MIRSPKLSLAIPATTRGIAWHAPQRESKLSISPQTEIQSFKTLEPYLDTL